MDDRRRVLRAPCATLAGGAGWEPKERRGTGISGSQGWITGAYSGDRLTAPCGSAEDNRRRCPMYFADRAARMLFDSRKMQDLS